MKRIYVLKEYCIGCGLCQVYCATIHSPYPDSIIKAYKLSPHRPISGLFTEGESANIYSLMCRHCDEPPCVAACITGAMYKETESGAVIVDKSRCVGCYTCITACPYGLIKPGAAEMRMAVKCDLCINISTMPQCVINCPNEALVYAEEGEECAM